MDFTQLAGNYLTNRMNRAVAPFEDPMAYLGNRVDQALDANVQPQTSTINPAAAATQDFVPGGELAIERPGTPISQYLQQAKQMSMPNAQPANMSVPVQPAEPELPPNAFPDPYAQMSRPDTVAAPGSASEAAAMSAAPNIYEHFRNNQNDLKSVSAIAFDDAAPGAVRFAANDKLRTSINNMADIKAKTAEIDAALADPSGKGAMKMMNAIAREREDGSLLKAIFYQRMGLNDLAKAEQLKLGAADSYQPVALPDGRQGYVKVNYQGAPVAGWTDAGEMSPQELINAQVGTKGAEIGTQAYKHRETGELYFLRRTTQGRAQMVNTQGQVYTGPTNQLFAYGIGSDVEQKNILQRQELQNKLAYAPATKRAEIVAEWEAKNGPMSQDARNRALSGQPLPDIIGAVPMAQERPAAAAPAPAVPAPKAEAAPVSEVPAPAPVVEAPAAVGNVPPMPTLNGQPSMGPKGQAWLAKYGATHNPDGTPKSQAAPIAPVVPGGTNMRVAPEVQARRDQGRAEILNQELVREQQTLATATDPVARQRAQANIDAINRELGTVQRQTGGRAEAVPAGGTSYKPGVFVKPQMAAGESIGAYEARVKAAQDAFNAQEARNKTIFEENLKREQSIREKQETLPIEQEAKEREAFVKTGEEVRNAGADGSVVKTLRKQQLDILRTNPQIAGIMYGKGTQYDNARRFILDTLSGRFSGQEGGAQRADELGKIALNPNEKAALSEFANLTANINQKTLRAASGPGAVSDAEQRANKEANLQFVERLEPLMVVNELNRSQFNSDLAAAKADFLNRNQFNTRKSFDSAWNTEQAKLVKQYEGIYKARLAYLKPYLEAVQKNPGDEAAIQRRRDAIMHSMNVYPAPEYDVQTGKWDYKTANARKAAMSSVLGR